MTTGECYEISTAGRTSPECGSARTPLDALLRKALAREGHEAVTIVYFPEQRLQEIGRELRRSMTIAGASSSAAMIVDRAVEGEDDDQAPP